MKDSILILCLQQHKCDFDASETVASDTGFVDVESGSESDLKKASASVGPISVAIDASHQSFQLYKGGKQLSGRYEVHGRIWYAQNEYMS